jgi:hypothetical protein
MSRPLGGARLAEIRARYDRWMADRKARLFGREDAERYALDVGDLLDEVARLRGAAASAPVARTLADWQRAVHDLTTRKGFHDGDLGNSVARLVALVREEAGELAGHVPFPDGDARAADGKPLGLRYEVADVVLTALDLAAVCGFDLAAAMAAKLAYNETRPAMWRRERDGSAP